MSGFLMVNSIQRRRVAYSACHKDTLIYNAKRKLFYILQRCLFALCDTRRRDERLPDVEKGDYESQQSVSCFGYILFCFCFFHFSVYLKAKLTLM